MRIRDLTRIFFDEEMYRVRNDSKANREIGRMKLREIESLMDLLIDLNVLEGMEVNINHSEFFTKLTMEIKKSGIWAQKKLLFISKEKLKYMESKLEE